MKNKKLAKINDKSHKNWLFTNFCQFLPFLPKYNYFCHFLPSKKSSKKVESNTSQ